MPFDLILIILAAVFPAGSCALFLIFWCIARDDAKPDPIYDARKTWQY